MSTAVAAAVKAALLALTDENARKKIGWVLVAIFSPVILLIALLCSLASGGAEHNISVVELCFHGGVLPAGTPVEYQEYIQEMRDSFSQLDILITQANEMSEDEEGLDAIRIKAIFYALYFGTDNPEAQASQAFLDCFVTHLADRLRFTSGKKQYGYLKAPLKAVVDEIVDELTKDPRVAKAYDLWYQMREEVLRTYRNDLPERLPLSQQKEFKRIKNMVIQEAVRLGELNQVFQPEENAQGQHEKDGEQSPNKLERLRQAAERGNPSAQYHLGKLLLQGNEIPKDAKDAVRWLTESAEQGNQYAQYALGKIYLLGKDAPKDFGTARMWFQRSADQGNQYAQYFVEHMDDHRTAPSAQSVIRLLYHMANIFREQTPPSAPGGIRSGVDRKLRRKIWEKKIAMGHKPDDHEEPMMNL